MNRTQRTRPARFAIRVAGLALTAVALTACGGESDEPDAAPTGSPSATTPSESPSETPAEEPSEEPSDEPSGATAKVTIEGGSVKPLAQSVEVGVGEPVTLQVTSDRVGELHVHATPEQYHDIEPGRTNIKLTFDKPGAVDVEEHETGALLLRVLVR
jgi:hypothetical protein